MPNQRDLKSHTDFQTFGIGRWSVPGGVWLDPVLGNGIASQKHHGLA